MFQASLDAISLPTQFKYKPYIPKKRNNTIRTANAVVLQVASPSQVIHGEDILSWTIEGVYPSEWQILWDQYNTDDPVLYEFIGYWGETLDVYFSVLDEPTTPSGLFNMSGSFQVMCVTTNYNASNAVINTSCGPG